MLFCLSTDKFIAWIDKNTIINDNELNLYRTNFPVKYEVDGIIKGAALGILSDNFKEDMHCKNHIQALHVKNGAYENINNQYE